MTGMPASTMRRDPRQRRPGAFELDGIGAASLTNRTAFSSAAVVRDLKRPERHIGDDERRAARPASPRASASASRPP